MTTTTQPQTPDNDETETLIPVTNFIVTSVWSSYGHRFMGTGESAGEGPLSGSYESCMTCGVQFVLVPLPEDDDLMSEDGIAQVQGEYRTNDGSEPITCTENTSLTHGYEAVCQADGGPGCSIALDGEICEHLAAAHGCNCVMCTG